MTDVNEQSFSAGAATDTAPARHSKSFRQRIPAPIWRFRPTLQPIQVVRTIKTQIVPKIVLALRRAPATRVAEAAERLPTEVEQFAALALGNDDDAALAYVEERLARGITVESIFLDLLAPAARQLGTLWESDAADFANVTLGVGRLQLIMRRLSDRFTDETNAFHAGESVLLTIIPGEQHSFGL